MVVNKYLVMVRYILGGGIHGHIMISRVWEQLQTPNYDMDVVQSTSGYSSWRSFIKGGESRSDKTPDQFLQKMGKKLEVGTTIIILSRWY